MKKIISLLIVVLNIPIVFNAQDLKIDFPSGTIELIGFSNFIIEGYDGNEVLIYEHYQENYNPSQAKGLKKINTRSTRKSTGVKHEIVGNVLKISEPYPMGSFLIQVPHNINVACIAKDLLDAGGNKNYSISNVKGDIEIWVMEMVNIELKEVTGQASIVTHGNIIANIKSLPKKGALSFDTYRGFVDVSLAKVFDLNVNLSAKEGDIYTNLNIVKKGSKINPENFLGTIGKGGTDLIINTEVGGNIYLRTQQ